MDQLGFKLRPHNPEFIALIDRLLCLSQKEKIKMDVEYLLDKVVWLFVFQEYFEHGDTEDVLVSQLAMPTWQQSNSHGW